MTGAVRVTDAAWLRVLTRTTTNINTMSYPVQTGGHRVRHAFYPDNTENGVIFVDFEALLEPRNATIVVSSVTNKQIARYQPFLAQMTTSWQAVLMPASVNATVMYCLSDAMPVVQDSIFNLDFSQEVIHPPSL